MILASLLLWLLGPALKPGIRYTGQAYYDGTRVAAGSFTADASLLPIGVAGAADL